MFGFVAGGSPSKKQIADYIYNNYTELFHGELDYGDSSATVALTELTSTRNRIKKAEGMDDRSSWTATTSPGTYTKEFGVSKFPKSTVFFINWRGDTNGSSHPQTWEVNGSTVTASFDVQDTTGPNDVGSAIDIFTHVHADSVSTITSSKAVFNSYTSNRQPHYGTIAHLPGEWEYVKSFATGDTESIPSGGMVVACAADSRGDTLAYPNYLEDYTTFGGDSVFSRIGLWYDRVQLACFVNNTGTSQDFTHDNSSSNTYHESFHLFKQV